MSSIRLQDVSIRLGKGDRSFTLNGVNVDIKQGEFLVIVGGSGTGKSTLLRAIAGLEELSGGQIWIGEQRVDTLQPAKRGLAMVFQNYALYPHMTVAENIGFSLKLAKMPKARIAGEVKRAAERLRIVDLMDRRPAELSGGQRQRVAIGRAIVRNPAAFLFDEPLSNLDASLRSHLRIELRMLHRQLGVTSLYVTHDQIEAMTLADRIVLLSPEGIEQIGTPEELFESPKNLYVAKFIGTPPINLLPAALLRAQWPAVASGLMLPEAVATVGFRPRRVRITDRGQIPGRIALVERLGDSSYVHIDVEGLSTPVIVSAHESPAPRESANVALELEANGLLYFDNAGKRLES